MAKPAQPYRPGIAFVTLTTHDKRPIFEIARIADLFIDTLLHYRTVGHYKIHAYVVMPDHVHLLMTPQGITLDQAVELIKHGFAYRLDSQLPVWQGGFTGYSVANLRDLEIVRAFIHQIPVRAHLAQAAELYRHSSAYRQNFAALPLTAIAGERSVLSAGARRDQAEENQLERPKLHIALATSTRKRAS